MAKYRVTDTNVYEVEAETEGQAEWAILGCGPGDTPSGHVHGSIKVELVANDEPAQ